MTSRNIVALSLLYQYVLATLYVYVLWHPSRLLVRLSQMPLVCVTTTFRVIMLSLVAMKGHEEEVK